MILLKIFDIYHCCAELHREYIYVQNPNLCDRPKSEKKRDRMRDGYINLFYLTINLRSIYAITHIWSDKFGLFQSENWDKGDNYWSTFISVGVYKFDLLLIQVVLVPLFFISVYDTEVERVKDRVMYKWSATYPEKHARINGKLVCLSCGVCRNRPN